MWLNIKRWLLIFLVTISILGVGGCEAARQINKPSIVDVELIGDQPKTIEGTYLFRFDRIGKDPKKPDSFNLGRTVQKLLLKDWNVKSPPELTISKKEATVSLVVGGAYELKSILTIAATPETASQNFQQSIVVEFPNIVGVAKFVEANIPACPPKVGSSPDKAPKPEPTPTNSPSPTPIPTATPTESASPTSSASPTATPTESASPTSSPSPTATPTESASPTSSPSPTATPTESASPTSSPSPTATPTESASPTSSASPTATPTESASPTSSASPTATPTESAAEETPPPSKVSKEGITSDRTPKEDTVPACVPKVEFQITHYSSYGQLGFDNIGKNILGIVGCALFVALMIWTLSDKWDILFEQTWYIAAAVSLYAVGLLGIPFFLFQLLKNIGWIVSGFFGM